jgi:hypothetical protein
LLLPAFSQYPCSRIETVLLNAMPVPLSAE